MVGASGAFELAPQMVPQSASSSEIPAIYGEATPYWYRRARKPVCKTSLDDEWVSITTALLGQK